MTAVERGDGEGRSSGLSARRPGTLLEYWGILVRRRAVVVGCLGLVIGVTLVLTLLATPIFTATATIEIEREGPDILTFHDVLNVDPSFVARQEFYQTQYRIMESRAVLRITAERVDLVNRPEFATRKGSPMRRLIGWVRSWIPSRTPEPAEQPDPLEPAIGFLAGGLHVSPVRNSQLVTISFADRDPILAADLANAVADAYQQFQFETRYDTMGKATEFLTKDVARVQSEVEQLQRQLQEMGERRELVSMTDGAPDISEQALADINRRYTEARTALVAAEARHLSIKDAPPEALEEVLHSRELVELRQEQSELERRVSQMAQRFNDDWPPLLELRRELQTADLQLEQQANEMASQVRAVSLASYNRARAEVQKFEQERELQKQDVQRVNRVAIEHASLRARIDTRRRVLSDLIARQSETETSHRLKDSATSNIRVLERAETPTAPSQPRKLRSLLLALFLGSVLGVGAALVFDYLDDSVKTENDVERLAGLTVLSHIPISGRPRPVGESRKDARTSTHQLDLASHLEPQSPFAEAFRSLRTSLLLATPDHPPRHVAVTSCAPGEGKSTVALNLAIVLTQLDRRVLLIDADLRRPRLQRALQLDNSVGLSSYLSGNASMKELAQECSVPNLRVITSGPVPPNPSELLGSARLRELLERLPEDHGLDHVILDSPPLLSVTDATVVSSSVDACIIVLRAGETNRDALVHSVVRLRRSRTRLVGAVLNGVSVATGLHYDRYRYYLPDDGEDAAASDSFWYRHGKRQRRRRAV